MAARMIEQETNERFSVSDDVGLTYEQVLWIAVGVIALALRLTRLGETPLSAVEARGAIQAWRAASGEGMPLMGYEPLLLALNSLLFTVLGANDALARLAPALFGVVLCLTPWLLRGYLGRLGALTTGLYLALSPTTLVASRQLGGATLAVAGAMASVGAMVRFIDTERRAWLDFSAIALAFAVTGGSAAYGILLPLAASYVLAWKLGGMRGPFALDHLLPRVSAWGRRWAITFVVAALVLATGVGRNPAGVSAVGEMFTEWWARFGPAASAPVSPLLLLTVYELPAIVFAIGGAAVAVRRGRRRYALLLVGWAGLGLLLLWLMPGRIPTDALWVVLPLAMLGGLAVEEISSDGWRLGSGEAVHLAVVLVLWAHVYLTLARYAARGDVTSLLLALVTVLVQVLVGLAVAVSLGWPTSLRTAAVGTGVALFLLTTAAAWGVAYGRAADPREPLLADPTAEGVRDLVETLEELSWRETGTPTTLPFVYEAAEDSVVTWYVRSFEQARRVDVLDDLDAGRLGATVVTVGREAAFPEDAVASYAGQDFAVSRRWTPRSVTCGFWASGCEAGAKWFLLRRGVELPEADEWVTLWRGTEASYSH